MAVIIQGIDIPKKCYMNGYYISDDGKVFDVSRKIVVGKAVQIPSGAKLIDANRLKAVFDKNVVSANAFDVIFDNAPTIFEED